MKLKSLLLRTVSGLVYVALIIGCVIGGVDSTAVLAALLASLGTIELSKVLGEFSRKRFPLLMVDVAASICLALGIYVFPLILWLLFIIVRLIESLYAKEQNPVKSLAVSFLTQIFVALPCGIMVANGALFTSGYIVLAVFFLLWINDTGAFIVGSLFGKHRLFERISPKKSWEGFFGGLVFNIIAAILFALYCPGFFGYINGIWQWIGLAVIVTVFGTWGDLVESLIKRTAGVKDSGNIIPGHGGILDRIDSMLLSMLACFIYFLILSWNNITAVSAF